MNYCPDGHFTQLMAYLAQGVEDHIRRDGLTGVRAAVFRDRGGHGSGEWCPSATLVDVHDMTCDLHFWGGETCTCRN